VKLASPRAVALALALIQAAVSSVAIVAAQSGRTSIIVAALSCLTAGVAIVALLDSPQWATGGWRTVAYENLEERSASDA
jgi:hypothetical protein